MEGARQAGDGKTPAVVVSLHVASGAAAGALVRTRGRAVVAGLLLHLLGDLTPHRDVRSRRFELVSGLLLLSLLAGRRGLADRALVGAVASSAPDLEHVLPFPRPGGRKLFPSHRVAGWHRSGGVSTSTQVVVAGLLVGALVGCRRRSSPPG